MNLVQKAIATLPQSQVPIERIRLEPLNRVECRIGQGDSRLAVTVAATVAATIALDAGQLQLNHEFFLVAGRSRFESLKAAGHRTVDAVILAGDSDAAERIVAVIHPDRTAAMAYCKKWGDWDPTEAFAGALTEKKGTV